MIRNLNLSSDKERLFKAAFLLRLAVGPDRYVGHTGCMDISIDAPGRSRENFSFTNFFLMHKGDLTLAFSAFVYLVSLAALMFTHWKTSSEIAVSMAEAALIGGLCDYIALKMIFERRWYLPNSGVLPRNRAKLIDGIAATIENEWLTPQMIGRKLSDMDLVGRLGTYMQEMKLQDILGQAGLERIISQAIDYLDSPEKRERLERVLKRLLPKTGTRICASGCPSCRTIPSCATRSKARFMSSGFSCTIPTATRTSLRSD